LQEESKHQKEEEEACEEESHSSLQEDGEHKREVENAEEPVTEEEEEAKEEVEQEEEEEEQMHGLIQLQGPEQEQCQYSPHIMAEEQEVSSELEFEAEGVHPDQLVPQIEGDDFRVKEGDNDHTSLPVVIDEGGHFNPLLTDEADASSVTTISVPADVEGCPAQNLEDEGLVSETWNGAYHAEESLHEEREQDESEKEAEEHAVQLVGEEDWAQEDQEALKQKQDDIDEDVAKLGRGDPWELQEHHPTEEEEKKDEELKENRSEEEDDDEDGDEQENQELGLGHMPEEEELEAHRAELEGEQQEKEQQEQEQQQQKQEHEEHEQEEERQELGLCHMPEGQLEAHQAVHEDGQYERQRQEQEWEEEDLRQELGLSHMPEEEELGAHRAELEGQQQEEEQPEQEQQQERQEQEEHEEHEEQKQQEQEEREQEEREQEHEEDRPELVLCNEPSREQERGPQSACTVQAEKYIQCQESEDEFGVVAATAEEGEEPVAWRDDAEHNPAQGADGQWGHSPAMPHSAAAPFATAEALMASAGSHLSPPDLFGELSRQEAFRVEQDCPERLLAESALKEETVSDKLPVSEKAEPEVKRPEDEKPHSAEGGCRDVAASMQSCASKAALLTALQRATCLALGTTFAVFSAVELAWRLGPQPDPYGYPYY